MSDELYHFGVKGMRWGVRTALNRAMDMNKYQRNKAKKYELMRYSIHSAFRAAKAGEQLSNGRPTPTWKLKQQKAIGTAKSKAKTGTQNMGKPKQKQLFGDESPVTKEFLKDDIIYKMHTKISSVGPLKPTPKIKQFISKLVKKYKPSKTGKKQEARRYVPAGRLSTRAKNRVYSSRSELKMDRKYSGRSR